MLWELRACVRTQMEYHFRQIQPPGFDVLLDSSLASEKRFVKLLRTLSISMISSVITIHSISLFVLMWFSSVVADPTSSEE